MRKSESLRLLEQLGLNTLDYFIPTNKQEAIHYIAKHSNDLISMRTERGNEFHCPFYYKMKGESLLLTAIKHFNEGYTLIFSSSLDTKGCLAFGAVGLGENEQDVIEFVLGPGKVRDLDNHPKRQTIFIKRGNLIPIRKEQCPEGVEILNTIYKIAKDNAYDYTPCILEWSWYIDPVGVKRKHEIFWEVRKYV